ncbi:hypothetical protein QN277_003551 [Acacia crassicarpa]|uniref:Trehalose 6-phosphate phosphatase n=1 Tax=Acacia crassicarpa TaxID=499986 RepID=A0AAE1IYM3_9FABA|nr:hypothetical protein QN277_003551 [Acacia crassicarpa]
MDLTSSHASPVLTDPVPISKSRLGMHSGLLSYSQQDSSSPLSSSLSPVKYSRTSSRKTSGNLDDVRSNGWLDAMKASSPPSKKHPNKAFNSHIDSSELDYSSWLLEYPSALDCFEEMIEHAKNKKIAMFLDYDGTLSPIVNDPDRAFMSEAMRSVVRNVAKCFPTAIISGRSREKVYDLVKLTELYYAGSHGMDIVGPASHTLSNTHPDCIKSTDQQGQEITLFQPARDFLPLIDEVYKRLVEKTKDIQGANVENHKFCVSVHYRNVEENNWTVIGQIVHDTLKDYPLLRSTHGRKVLDIRPVIDWNKGKAVEFLLDCLGLSEGDDDVFAIFIGDDKTDEDAFKVLRERKGGFGILVSSTRKQSNASYSLRDTSEVMKFLEMLVNWKREEENKQQQKRHSF